MTGIALKEQADKMAINRPDIQPGYTVRVHTKIQMGDKDRVQIFEGLVIGVHRGHSPTDCSFTVRKVASGIGVERVFPLYSPNIEKIEVKKIAKVRRAKLNFLRGRAGKSAKLSERFTNADEFATAIASEEVVAETPVVEAQAADAPVAETGKEEAK
ncbi:MAG: 50S ribosomal protein L19 [Candidatus Peribacteraceae bacterium]|nr:50S ribosomal protein L19 [Candidatus Peribacteraceae bacterium]MBP9850252.1 50S ribosomal protein L19 [Candidatus Peribacteraceae bacterium]